MQTDNIFLLKKENYTKAEYSDYFIIQQLRIGSDIEVIQTDSLMTLMTLAT